VTTKRIMLLGASGQIGQALQAENLPADWQLGSYGRAECDITRHGMVQGVMRDFKPDLAINAAAMVAVDQCEKEQDKAVTINFEGPANLAAQCAAMDIPLIHISTDFVFDGMDSMRPYNPDDPMNPLNVYGNTKMMGEESVRHEHAWHVILRTSSVFSEFGSNLLTRTLKTINENPSIKSVTDQKASPTYAPDIAKALIRISDAILSGKSDGFGTFHLCGTPAATRLEFTKAIMETYATHGGKRPEIIPALSSDFPGLAPRPAYSALDCTKIEAIYGITPRPWQEGLNEAISRITAAKTAEN